METGLQCCGRRRGTRYRRQVPNQHFEHSITIATDREIAWAHLQEARTWEALAGIDEVHNVKHDVDGQLVSYEFVAIAGGRRYPGLATVAERSRPDRLVLRIDSSEIDGSITVDFHEDSPLEMRVALYLNSKGLLSTMFFPVVAASVGSGFPKQVDEFAARVSSA